MRRDGRTGMKTNPKRSALLRANRALDASNFFLADVRDGLGHDSAGVFQTVLLRHATIDSVSVAGSWTATPWLTSAPLSAVAPYLAVYLLTIQKWDEASIGLVLSVTTVAGIPG